jgi:Ca2+-binding RTX toxin-like protein
MLIAAAPAGAATVTLGQVAPAGTPGSCCGSSFQRATAAASPAYTVPAGNWVITSWAARADTGQGSAQVRVFRHVGGETSRLVAQSAAVALVPGSADFHPVQIAVEAGDVLGISAFGSPGNANQGIQRFPGAAGDIAAIVVGGMDTGQDAPKANSGPTPRWNEAFDNPSRTNVQAVLESDGDDDGIQDSADTDFDNDGAPNDQDAFPNNANEAVDTDGDGTGNNADTDDDNDGVPDGQDPFPLNANEGTDTDGDGTGDNADTDDDNDGILDADEPARGTNPLLADSDADTRGDGADNCPAAPNPDQADYDRDGRGDACDVPSAARCGNVFTGSAVADVLNGGALGDTLAGLEGDDRLNGLAGDDCLGGGAGDDIIAGGAGTDTLAGHAGNDRLKGDSGKDRLSGGDGSDSLSGGAGDDKLNGGQNKDRFKAGAGNDVVSARDGRRESVDCGSGSRDLATVDRTDTVRGCERVKRP